MRTEADTRRDPSGDVLRESRHRIRVAAGLGAAANLVFLVSLVAGLQHEGALERRLDLTNDVVGLALCGGMFLLTLAPWITDRLVLTLALAFEIAISALISIVNTWAAFLHTGHVPGLSWVVPVLILFALLVPSPPRESLLVSTACALTMPLGIAALAATGQITASASDYAASSLAALVGLGLATVASRTLHGARREAAAARRMGGYELLQRIGGGGMGEVWEARHLMLARPAAVKLILAERLQAHAEAREAAVQRFTREAQVTASLRSPYTVQLFDFGVSDDGVLYYAMELLEGMNLEHFIYKHGAVEPRRAVHWLRQVCHSLGEAHASGLTHRDLKPANLFVCRYGREHDFLKVLDFGLARPTAHDGEARLTREGSWLGTPGWMAPEQIFAGATGPSADLYALGCIAYWLLSGTRPFESAETSELLRQHAQVMPPAVRERAKQDVPAALDDVVMACLAKDPSARPRDADELSDRLARSVPGDAWSEADASTWWKSASRSGGA
jgi:serine/threonine-protein kinase